MTKRKMDMELLSKTASLLYLMVDWGSDQEYRKLSPESERVIQGMMDAGEGVSEREKIYSVLRKEYSSNCRKDTSKWESFAMSGWEMPKDYKSGTVHVEEIQRLKDIMFLREKMVAKEDNFGFSQICKMLEEVEIILAYRVLMNMPEFKSILKRTM